jgi:A/G-specific adenine glycosylase
MNAKPAVSPATARSVRAELLAWYDANLRDLPWRRTRDPYAIWVSEMMLQQTQVATVEGYYTRWMKRFPTVAALASSPVDDVLHAWQGLGYYSRARNLWRGARAVVSEHGGRVPGDVDALLTLPGIGPYSAGAIASIAHGRRAALVDGNVIRVLCRLFGLRGDPTRAPLKNELWARAGALVPEQRPGDFNQALMELGATTCTPRNPECPRCPLRARCVAHREGTSAELPELPRRAMTVRVPRAALVLSARGRVLCVQVPGDAARWAGMWQFPNADVQPGESADGAARRALREASGIDVSRCTPLVTVRHSVTHHRITLEVFSGKTGAVSARRGALSTAWVRPGELEELAMPAAHRKIARALKIT